MIINLRFKHYFWVSRFQRKGLPSSALLWCSQSFIEEVDCFLGRSAAYFSWFLNAFTSFILEFMLTCHEYTHKKHETGFNISLSEFIQSFLLAHYVLIKGDFKMQTQFKAFCLLTIVHYQIYKFPITDMKWKCKNMPVTWKMPLTSLYRNKLRFKFFLLQVPRMHQNSICYIPVKTNGPFLCILVIL